MGEDQGRPPTPSPRPSSLSPRSSSTPSNIDKAEPILAALANRELKKGTPWGEKAQYFLAETQYRRRSIVAANDNFSG